MGLLVVDGAFFGWGKTGVANSIAMMFTTTIALIFACILGVSGIATDFEVTPDALVLTHVKPFGVAFGGIAFANAYNRDHELGHLAQEDLLGALYLPVVGIPSLISAVVNNHENHRPSWTERWADGIQ